MSAGESIKYGIAKCDSSMIPLIIGGTKADRTEFPHQASIGYGGPTEFLYACGGSLISEKFVLSAGHCIKDRMRFVEHFIYCFSDYIHFFAPSTKFVYSLENKINSNFIHSLVIIIPFLDCNDMTHYLRLISF